MRNTKVIAAPALNSNQVNSHGWPLALGFAAYTGLFALTLAATAVIGGLSI